MYIFFVRNKATGKIKSNKNKLCNLCIFFCVYVSLCVCGKSHAVQTKKSANNIILLHTRCINVSPTCAYFTGFARMTTTTNLLLIQFVRADDMLKNQLNLIGTRAQLLKLVTWPPWLQATVSATRCARTANTCRTVTPRTNEFESNMWWVRTSSFEIYTPKFLWRRVK